MSPIEVVEEIHAEALSSGGAGGLLHPNLLLSAVEGPKAGTFDGRSLYPSLAEMAATYAWGIARNHPFVDGNKRTALLTALTFLDMNGRRTRVGSDWVELMVAVASGNIRRDELVQAFVRAMSGDEAIG